MGQPSPLLFRLFDWRPDKLRGERARNENVVVLKRLFKPEEFDVNPAMLLEYQRDLREECAKFGHVKRVVIFDVGFWLYSVWPSQNIN
jgi:HIV Tat-specific factor 1